MKRQIFLKVALRGVIFLVPVLIFFARPAGAATNINSSTTLHWAWNDLIGWIDFYNTNSVNVSSQNLNGYASSSAGYVSLDCHSPAPGTPNICSQSNYQVTNDGLGNLSNWAWNDEFGWISFDCHNNNWCGVSNYQVQISPTTGDFSGWAWNDVIGWISFCGNSSGIGNCGTTPSSTYKVNTSWIATSTSGTLDSSTYDTGVAAGAQLNSVLWQGNASSGTSVGFQFATSNSSSGPWTFIGPDGTSNSYYTPSGPNISLKLSYTLHNNFRYFRYRVKLTSNQAQTFTPRVDDVIVNWSP